MKIVASRSGPLAVGLLALVGSASSVAAQQMPDPIGILERASREYSALQGFCAEFDQTLTVPLLDQVTHSTGRMCQRQPDRFSMRFSDPDGDLVLADGEWLWIYFPSTDPEQVIRSALTPGQQGRFDFHQEFLTDPGTKYEPTYMDTDMLDGSLAHVIRLVPRQASAYQEARIWIDQGDAVIRRVEIEEENGSVREVALAQFVRNPTLPDGSFDFTPPSGVQIITR